MGRPERATVSPPPRGRRSRESSAVSRRRAAPARGLVALTPLLQDVNGACGISPELVQPVDPPPVGVPPQPETQPPLPPLRLEDAGRLCLLAGDPLGFSVHAPHVSETRRDLPFPDAQGLGSQSRVELRREESGGLLVALAFDV